MKIEGSVAIVTGGGGLLGSRAVAELVDRGATVVVADLTPGRLADASSRFGDKVRFVPTDVTSEADVAAAVEEAAATGDVRVLLNCAGVGMVRRTLSRDGERHDVKSFRRMLEINVVGSFLFLTHATEAMSRVAPLDDGERGVVINTSSLAGLEGSAGQLAYGVAKAAVAGMTLPAARDLGPVGIRVMTIAPGGMTDPAAASPADDARTAALLSSVPHPRRFGTPADYAMLVTQIIENPYLNGSVIRLDGGARLGLKV